MKWTGCVWGVSLLLLWAPLTGEGSDAPDVNEIMKRVYDRDDGDDASSEIQMTLIDRSGAKRERRIKTLAKDFGADSRQVIFFLSPADVEGTGFLTYDYAGVSRDDDQWLYLPSLKKTKRIASADQSGKFLGTDFNYADLTERENDQYAFELLGEEAVRGEPAWKIRATPNEREIERTGYTKSVIWVLKSSYVVVRAVHYVREGQKLKYFDVARLELVEGIWSALEVSMTTKLKDQSVEHRTLLSISNLDYGRSHDPELFSVRQLEKGP